MKAMIFSAGKGNRMRELTQNTPKPLLKVRGLPLIEHHIVKLKCIGIKEYVINVSYLGQQIIDYLGDGSKWGVHISYSIEYPEPLETGGGLEQALTQLGDEPFICINADVWMEGEYTWLLPLLDSSILPHKLGIIFLVDNPYHNKDGDFQVQSYDNTLTFIHQDSQLKCKDVVSKTFAGVSLFDPNALKQFLPEYKLGTILRKAIKAGCLDAEHLNVSWFDIGTPERLHYVNQSIG